MIGLASMPSRISHISSKLESKGLDKIVEQPRGEVTADISRLTLEVEAPASAYPVDGSGGAVKSSCGVIVGTTKLSSDIEGPTSAHPVNVGGGGGEATRG